MKIHLLHMLAVATLAGAFALYVTETRGLQPGADAKPATAGESSATFEKVPAAVPETQGKDATAAADQSLKTLQEDFLKLKFGMFIHFNMATFKEVQWVAGYTDPSDFNPDVETINTDAWAEAAMSAGMTYAVLTVKHTSGFCLWDSKYTTYDVMNPKSGYQKDLVEQFIESFKSRGLKVGLYYCWRHPGFGSPDKYKVLPPECDPATHSLEEQIEFQVAQINELLEKYPDVFYIWNDGLDPVIAPADQILPRLRAGHPGVIISGNWWDWSKKGQPYADIAVTETNHFPEGNTLVGETCWTLEQNWFWQDDFRPKSAQEIVCHIRTANNRNSNFLLNVAPDKQGNFSKESIKVLAEIGKLLK